MTHLWVALWALDGGWGQVSLFSLYVSYFIWLAIIIKSLQMHMEDQSGTGNHLFTSLVIAIM